MSVPVSGDVGDAQIDERMTGGWTTLWNKKSGCGLCCQAAEVERDFCTARGMDDRDSRLGVGGE